MMKLRRLQTTQSTHREAVTVVSKTVVQIVLNPRKPAVRTRCMPDTAPHKSVRYRDNNHTETCMDFKYPPETNIL